MAKGVPANDASTLQNIFRLVSFDFRKNHQQERFPIKFVKGRTDLILRLDQFSHPSQIKNGSDCHWNSIRQ